MKKLGWGFAIFTVLLLGLFIAGHLETDGKSTGLVFTDPPAEQKIEVFDGQKVTHVEVPRNRNKPLFPRIHRLFHPKRD